MNATVRALFVLIIAACAVGLVAVAVTLVTPENRDHGYSVRMQLPTLGPCPTEDSDNCYWDAQSMGNGLGTDSVVLTP